MLSEKFLPAASYLIAFLVVLTAASAFAGKVLPPELIDPDGKPVADAVIYRLWSMKGADGKDISGVDKFTLAEWKEGAALQSNANRQLYGYHFIKAPGCAMYLWNAVQAKCQLEKEYFLKSKIVDLRGKPVSGVDVSIGRVAENSFLRLTLRDMASLLPWCQTVSDENGNFTLPGITLMDFDPKHFSSEVLAWTKRDGIKLLGSASLGPEQPVGQDEEHAITLVPCDVITGSIIDAHTGKPIQDVEVGVYGLKFDHSFGKYFIYKTDQNGTFLIDGLRANYIHIEHDGYAEFHVEAGPHMGEWHQDKLAISLRPEVNVRIKLVDDATKQPVREPFCIYYKINEPLGGRWTAWLRDRRWFGENGIDESGVVIGELPAGDLEFTYYTRLKRKHQHTMKLTISADGVSEIVLPWKQ